MRFLVDTNVFLRFVEVDSPEFGVCDRALEAVRNGSHTACYCAQIVIEFWSVATRPRKVNGLAMSIADAQREIEDIKMVFECLGEPEDMAERWQRVAVEHSVIGKQAHDARIAALMLAHGVTHLLTLNTSDFVRYQEITPATPEEVLQLVGAAD